MFGNDFPDTVKPRLALEEVLGAAYMRRGEVQNCMLDPNAERCLFPVLAGGRHRQIEGVSAASAQFVKYLADAPDDLEVRWLLNVAHMLLGTYPGSVPEQHLLKPEIFESEYPLPRFVDVAGPTRLGRTDIAGGTIADDFDGDGLLDVVFSSVDNCTPPDCTGTAATAPSRSVSEAAGPAGQLGGINVVQTDYNNDGRLDIFVMRGGWEVPMRNSLLRNNGDGTFTDVTREAGLLERRAPARTRAAWADYDNDGWLDVFVGHELTPASSSAIAATAPSRTSRRAPAWRRWPFTKGVTAGDYDGDGYPDLYVSNMFGGELSLPQQRRRHASPTWRVKLGRRASRF